MSGCAKLPCTQDVEKFLDCRDRTCQNENKQNVIADQREQSQAVTICTVSLEFEIFKMNSTLKQH